MLEFYSVRQVNGLKIEENVKQARYGMLAESMLPVRPNDVSFTFIYC